MSPAPNISPRFQIGLKALQNGDLAGAEAGFDAVLAHDARHLGALCMLAEVAAQTGRLHMAIKLLRDAANIAPRNAEIQNNLGIMLARSGKRADAQKAYQKAVSLKPDFFQACNNLGTVLRSAGDNKAALASFDTAIRLSPSYFDAHLNRANTLRSLGRTVDALKAFDLAEQIEPDNVLVYINRGLLLREMKRIPEALTQYDIAIALRPNLAEAYLNKGVALQDGSQLIAALEAYAKAIALRADFAEAHNNSGNALLKLGRPQEALAAFDTALLQRQNYVEALNGRAATLIALGKPTEALAICDRIIALRPDFAKVQSTRVEAFSRLGRKRDALSAANAYVSQRPDIAESFVTRGDCYRALNQARAAVDDYSRAIALDPKDATIFARRATAHTEMSQSVEALSDCRTALALDAAVEGLEGIVLTSKMAVCDWTDLDFSADNIHEILQRNADAIGTLPVLALSKSSQLNYQITKRHVELFALPTSLAAPFVTRLHNSKIHVGYFSGDFRNHATAYLMAEMFELHDRENFEITGFAFGPDDESPLRRRLANSFDRFMDVDQLPDLDVASLARKLKVDIAVDLKGYTQFARTGIFAHRAAPVQVNYLGYPGTMATDYFDYILADPVVLPPGDLPFFSEKLACLPHSYLMNDSRREVSSKVFSRQELGLPDGAFVFCSFNANYKITPDVFSSWMRILARVDNSVLWLLEGSAQVTANLCKEAVKRGIHPRRLIFAPKMPVGEHLARQSAADLFLDTLPYNAHTTAMDALWGGLPVLTHLGETFAGRVASSLLTSIGMPELITKTSQEYENLAVSIAQNPEMAVVLKSKLEAQKFTMPLFDTRRTARNVEAAFKTMVEIQASGQPTRAFAVKEAPEKQ